MNFMSEASGNDQHVDPAVRYRRTDVATVHEAAVLARVLERAIDFTGGRVGAREVSTTVLDYAAEGTDWTTTAASAAHALGLHAHRSPEPPSGLRRGRTAIARTPSGQWIIAAGHGRRRLRVLQFDERGSSSARMTQAQLREATAGGVWLHLQPLLALDPIGAIERPTLATQPWQRLRAFLGLDRRALWIVVVYAVVIGGLTLATPVAVQALVNTVAFGSVLQPLVVLTILLSAGLGFSAVLSLLEAYVVEVLQRRAFVRIADDFGRRLPALTHDALDDAYGPELANRFFDVVTIQKSLAVLLLDGLALTLQTAIGMVLLGFYHPLLLAFDVVLIVLLTIVLMAGRGAVASGLRESSAKYRTAAWLQDISRGRTLFRSAVARRHASDHTEMLCRDYLTARKSHFRILLRQIAGGLGLQIVAIVALLGVGGWLVIARQLTLGQLVAAELVIAAMGAGFVKLGKNLEKLYDLNVGVLKLGKVVDMPLERRGGEALSADAPKSLALHDVTVARGGRILVSAAQLSIEPGECVRLAGPAGSGKSTILDVLAGLRQPKSGSVHIGGLDLRRADLPIVRDRLALVRGSEFVEGTVLENLRLTAAHHATEPEIRKLLELLEVEHDLDRLPRGLETPMMPSGAPLSDTQLRRLALVRALLSEPRILIVDRALDALGLSDAGYDALLHFIFAPAAGWTVLAVTDDPRVAARCARTMVIDQHTLVEAA